MGHMKTAACGHQVDVWFDTSHVVCKDCFTAKGFVYNRNSYADIDKREKGARSIGVASGPALSEYEKRRVRLARRAAA